MKRIGFLLLALAALFLCVASAHAQGTVNGPQEYRIRGYVKDTTQGASGHTADTVKLAQTSAKYTWVKVVPRNGSYDTVTAITGGLAGAIYAFQTASKDTGVVFYKATSANLRLSANVPLTDTNDVLLLWYDGSLYREISASANH